MDRLPWTRFHWLVVIGLGVSWILDGIEIQIVSSMGGALQSPHTLHLTSAQVGATASVYLAGQVVGALFFGRLTDKLGRKRLFIMTLLIYLLASGLAGLSWNLWVLLVCRFVAGMGIGGEYTAINSAIGEIIPAKYRGRVDIAINGTYWGGAAIGAAATLVLYNENLVPVEWGWRLGFFIGPILGLAIIFVRRSIPESPRWLLTHGRAAEAERTLDAIENQIRTDGIALRSLSKEEEIAITSPPRLTLWELAYVFFEKYPRRSFLGFSMMATQAFLYNAIFFTQGMVLIHFYDVPLANTGYYFFPFALGNLLGPLLLGPLFDTIGRRVMISSTYLVSGVLLFVSAWAFHAQILSAAAQTLLWCVIFFFASAGASSAYLTVSEIFPLELRGQAIAFFFAISQGVGGVVAPFLFGHLIGGADNPNPDRNPLTAGYVMGALIMMTGGVIAWYYGVNAERKALEDIAEPLSKAPVQRDISAQAD